MEVRRQCAHSLPRTESSGSFLAKPIRSVDCFFAHSCGCEACSAHRLSGLDQLAHKLLNVLRQWSNDVFRGEMVYGTKDGRQIVRIVPVTDFYLT